jgi:Holliday junction resolvase RusA-like endonuclease
MPREKDLLTPAPRNISFTVPGQPVPWGVHTRYDRSESKDRLKAYQDMIRVAARRAMRGHPPHEGPVTLEMWFHLEIPDSAGKRPETRARWIERHLIMKPDTTNLQKAAEDGLTEQSIKGVAREMLGIVFIDDGQVIDTGAHKRYAQEGHTVFIVQLL